LIAAFAAFAAFDPARAHCVVRASKTMATSNFTGSSYRARFNSEDEVRRWIADHRIGWLVLDNGPDSLEMLHDQQVAILADAGQPGWRLVSEHGHARGTVGVFRLDGPPLVGPSTSSVIQPP
jgi:hypothetical protein